MLDFNLEYATEDLEIFLKEHLELLDLVVHLSICESFTLDLLHFIHINFFKELPFNIEFSLINSNICNQNFNNGYEIIKDVKIHLIRTYFKNYSTEKKILIVEFFKQYFRKFNPYSNRKLLIKSIDLHFEAIISPTNCLNLIKEYKKDKDPYIINWINYTESLLKIKQLI